MSRSYKKTPIIKSGGPKGKRIMKRISNHQIRAALKRNNDYCLSHKLYRKHTNSWEISEQVSYWSENQARQYYEESINDNRSYYGKHTYSYYFKKMYPSYKHFLKSWSKDYRWK